MGGNAVRYVDEYRDPALATALLDEIATLAGDRHWRFMEVCGGHTHTIYRHGIEHMLPDNVELVHGPGCPVCVIPMGRIDDAIALAETPGVTLATFGDLLRVPGSRARGNLLEAKGRGGDVRVVYSPLDALRLAEMAPDRDVVFLAVGFETTSPATAVTVLQARRRGIRNFSVLSNHVTIVPAIKAILDSPGMRLDGFIGPGHVSTTIGNRPYRFVAEQYGKPLVTAGFEPIDVLEAIAMLLASTEAGDARSRTSTPASSVRTATRALSVSLPRSSSFARTSSGAVWVSSHVAGCVCGRSTPPGTPRSATPFPASGWPTRRRASAARSSRGPASPGNAKCSAPPARPRRRSARAWSPPKGRARRTTATGGCAATSQSGSAGRQNDE